MINLQLDRTAPNLESGEWAMFLDIDGTLLEHADHPDNVSVDDELRRLIIGLDERLEGALALVSGRSIGQIDRLFSPLKLRAAGLYGLEHRFEQDGAIEPAKEPEDIAAFAIELEAQFRNEAGVFIERKGPVLAIHTRAAPHALAAVHKAAELALPRLAAGYRIVSGNAGIELLPVEAIKSAAIRRFMAQEPFAGRQPVFIGDDVSDESGFELVNANGGISIRVRPGNKATAARHVLADVAATKAWLRDQFITARK